MKSIITYGFLILILAACQKKDNIKFPQPPKADAGIDQNLAQPVTSFVLSGNATTTNGYVKGYLWSVISGPNNPSISSPSSKSTTISNVITGTYYFQFLIVDNAGLSDADTVKIIISNTTTNSITIQPENSSNERHLFGNNSIDESSFAPEIVAATWTSGSEVVYVRGLLKFDLSSIPSNAKIISAYLSLYSNPNSLNGNGVDANSGTDNSMLIRRVTNTWIGAETFWANQPSSTSTDQIIIPHTNQKTLDLINIDVKNLISSMKSSGNYGFLIRLQNEFIYNMRNFCSSRNSNTSKRPKLVVTYQ